jgi:hypothetical protein
MIFFFRRKVYRSLKVRCYRLKERSDFSATIREELEGFWAMMRGAVRGVEGRYERGRRMNF